MYGGKLQHKGLQKSQTKQGKKIKLCGVTKGEMNRNKITDKSVKN